MQKEKEIRGPQLSADASAMHIEILTGVLLFAFGVYHSVLYFGHTVVPNGDFPDLFKIGRDLLSLRLPTSFKQGPVLGLLQNFLYPFAWGPSRELTAGRLLNAIVHPFTVVLLWLVGKRILGGIAVWLAIIVAINPWTIYSLTEPINETSLLFFVLLTVYLILCRSRWAYLAASITTMLRYEGAALIMAAFVADVIHRKDRRDIIRAAVFSAIASVPLVIWLMLTFVTWQPGTTHYFNVLFSKEYAKTFTEPVSGRTGILLHWQLDWQVGFRPLLMPYPGAGGEFTESLVKLSKLAAVCGFLLGCVFAIFKRRWEILTLLLFLAPYFVLHAYYPYPLPRFHSTIFWIVLMIWWFGWQGLWGLLNKNQSRRAGMPRPVVVAVQSLVAIAAIAWTIGLFSYLPQAAQVSPTSVSMPYVAMFVACVIAAGRFYAVKPRPASTRVERGERLPGTVCVVAILCLIITSNQFSLARLVNDGQKEVEFKLLGEWFSKNAKPDEKMAVYLDGPTKLFAGKLAGNIVSFPKTAGPEELVGELREQGVTYVVWATREGKNLSNYPDYQSLELDKNIVQLSEPRSVGPYQFVTQLGSNRGFVNIFRLKYDDK